MKTLCGVIISIVLTSTGLGRIGETYEQCVRRYGEPVSQSKQSVVFEKSDLRIVAFFSADKCICIVVAPSVGKLSDAARDVLLQANLGFGFIANSPDLWTSKNGAIKASDTGDSLVIYDVIESEKAQKAEDAKVIEKLDGF